MNTARANVVFGLLIFFLASSAWADGAAISNVTVRQRWPWDRKVDIDYQLLGESGQSFDVSVTARNGSQILALPDVSLSGDRFDVRQGKRRIVWNPMVTGYTNETLTKFNVCLTPTNPPLYMIVDLTRAAGADGQIIYVYESDLTGGAYGSVETNPVPGVESLVWTGVTNNAAYMTTNLVLRRVASGSFQMGGSTEVTLTKGLYAGVFELTQAQWYNVMSNSISYSSVYPKADIAFGDVRGFSAGTNWPSSHGVDATSFIAKLRARTELSGFDLPTEAQGEYICRAGTTSYYYDGVTTSADTSVLNGLAWWLGNSGNAAHPVGKKLPNAWGLYDTIGNLGEWCLDRYAGTTGLPGGTDPVGVTSGVSRAFRGYHYTGTADGCGSGSRFYFSAPSTTSPKVGMRVVVFLP